MAGASCIVAREVDPRAVEFPPVAEAGVGLYEALEQKKAGIQIAFASMFTLIALIVLLSAIWFGLNFANRLVAPIRRLIHATDQVATGNFYVQVPVRRGEGDLGHLGETFNKMTSELRRQHDGLTAASDLMDRRRRFTEAVLAGVSAGVIGINARGRDHHRQSVDRGAARHDPRRSCSARRSPACCRRWRRLVEEMASGGSA